MNSDLSVLAARFRDTGKTAEESVNLTGVVTNRIVRYAIDGNEEFSQDAKFLDDLFAPLKVDEETEKGLESMKVFLPKVPSEIFERYRAIRKEIDNLKNQGAKNLIVAACGLSPLGLLYAGDKSMNVYDTDLEKIVSYRNRLGLNNNPNYHVQVLDMLDSGAVEKFIAEVPNKKTAVLVEGLTFYLDEEKRKVLNENLSKMARTGDATFILDYYVAKMGARQRDSKIDPKSPYFESFRNVIGNVHSEQKCFMPSREAVIDYLKSEGFKNVRVSKYCSPENAHTIFVAGF
jgi:O-methyltransferase involved in polyketide biosynthesis